jgi:hypothetical protein
MERTTEQYIAGLIDDLRYALIKQHQAIYAEKLPNDSTGGDTAVSQFEQRVYKHGDFDSRDDSIRIKNIEWLIGAIKQYQG